MIILKSLNLLKYLAIFTITLSQIQSSLAEESKSELLMRALYEHDQKADFSNDPEGKKTADALKKSYEEMQKSKKRLDDTRLEIEIMEEVERISKERIKRQGRKDYYHEWEQNVAKKYGVSQEEAHKMIESYDPRADRVAESMVQARRKADIKEAKKNIEERKKKEKDRANLLQIIN